MIVIYTDGSSRGNPGPGGYGVVLKYKSFRKELSEGFRKTTNNRMELLAVIVGLEALKKEGEEVKIYSDSKYVVDAVEKGWLKSWISKNFAGKKNKDLWLRFWEIYKKHKVKFEWLRGHAGNEENEVCDKLAVKSACGDNLKVDIGYEQGLDG